MFSQGGAKKVGPSDPIIIRGRFRRNLNYGMLSQGQLSAVSGQLSAPQIETVSAGAES